MGIPKGNPPQLAGTGNRDSTESCVSSLCLALSPFQHTASSVGPAAAPVNYSTPPLPPPSHSSLALVGNLSGSVTGNGLRTTRAYPGRHSDGSVVNGLARSGVDSGSPWSLRPFSSSEVSPTARQAGSPRTPCDPARPSIPAIDNDAADRDVVHASENTRGTPVKVKVTNKGEKSIDGVLTSADDSGGGQAEIQDPSMAATPHQAQPSSPGYRPAGETASVRDEAVQGVFPIGQATGSGSREDGEGGATAAPQTPEGIERKDLEGRSKEADDEETEEVPNGAAIPNSDHCNSRLEPPPFRTLEDGGDARAMPALSISHSEHVTVRDVDGPRVCDKSPGGRISGANEAAQADWGKHGHDEGHGTSGHVSDAAPAVGSMSLPSAARKHREESSRHKEVGAAPGDTTLNATGDSLELRLKELEKEIVPPAEAAACEAVRSFESAAKTLVEVPAPYRVEKFHGDVRKGVACDSGSVKAKNDECFFTHGAAAKGRTNWGAGVCGRGELLLYTGKVATAPSAVVDAPVTDETRAGQIVAERDAIPSAASTCDCVPHRPNSIGKPGRQGSITSAMGAAATKEINDGHRVKENPPPDPQTKTRKPLASSRGKQLVFTSEEDSGSSAAVGAPGSLVDRLRVLSSTTDDAAVSTCKAGMKSIQRLASSSGNDDTGVAADSGEGARPGGGRGGDGAGAKGQLVKRLPSQLSPAVIAAHAVLTIATSAPIVSTAVALAAASGGADTFPRVDAAVEPPYRTGGTSAVDDTSKFESLSPPGPGDSPSGEGAASSRNSKTAATKRRIAEGAASAVEPAIASAVTTAAAKMPAQIPARPSAGGWFSSRRPATLDSSPSTSGAVANSQGNLHSGFSLSPTPSPDLLACRAVDRKRIAARKATVTAASTAATGSARRRRVPVQLSATPSIASVGRRASTSGRVRRDDSDMRRVEAETSRPIRRASTAPPRGRNASSNKRAGPGGEGSSRAREPCDQGFGEPVQGGRGGFAKAAGTSVVMRSSPERQHEKSAVSHSEQRGQGSGEWARGNEVCDSVPATCPDGQAADARRFYVHSVQGALCYDRAFVGISLRE